MTIKTLKRQAAKAAQARGHKLTNWRDTRWLYADPKKPTQSTNRCVCGASVWVNSLPAPNEIGIAGEAVALNCVEAA